MALRAKLLFLVVEPLSLPIIMALALITVKVFLPVLRPALLYQPDRVLICFLRRLARP